MTDNRLNFILNHKYPLIEEFKETCPGSFKHSQNLSHMIEAICSKSNLNVSLAKAAAIVHDIGKILNPKIFVENQIGENIHEKLDPHISFQLISRHVSDSVAILINDHNIPRELIEIISQHHGTRLMKCFFQKSECINDQLFRYKLTKPKTIESAILMICDVIEARKSRKQLEKKLNSEEILNFSIDELVKDNQFEYVNLDIKFMNIIREVLLEELNTLEKI